MFVKIIKNYNKKEEKRTKPSQINCTILFWHFFCRTRQLDGLIIIFFGETKTYFVSLKLDQGYFGSRSHLCGIGFKLFKNTKQGQLY